MYLPATGDMQVTETAGGAPVAADRAPSVARAGEADGRVVFEVGSGLYRFEVGPERR